MAPPRIETVDMTYHVNGKAVDGMKLYRDEFDRQMFSSCWPTRLVEAIGASSAIAS
jgi:hypothetical protein